jgi:triacylglycerol esterase/lipase EstA (alpha/beta hydrolase family)
MKIVFRFVSTTLLVALVVISTANAFFNQNDEVPDNKELIVLLHGLGRSNASMWLLASRLEDAGYYVQRVGYSSLDQNPDEILKDVSSQINQCCQKHTQRVHFVGHSLGGLMV